MLESHPISPGAYGSTRTTWPRDSQSGTGCIVWYEPHETMRSAIRREKAIKEWKRKWKLEMIEKTNPDWEDPYESIL